MRERPILFSGPMVRALLDGTKTQTRRIVKPQPLHDGGRTPRVNYDDHGSVMSIGDSEKRIACPYGQPGDRLWVRETWQAWYKSSYECDEWDVCACAPSKMQEAYGNPTVEYQANSGSVGPWRPSIHMPRWASRITLEVTGVRVERLQDISTADCYEEGIESVFPEMQKRGLVGSQLAGPNAYRELWESINGPGSWAANPFVWVVEFRRIVAGSVLPVEAALPRSEGEG